MACSSYLYRGSDETSSHDCDVCKYQNITSGAESYCNSCDEFLCAVCEKVHRGSKLTRNHKLLSGNNLPSKSTRSISTAPTIFCEDHKTMIVNMYCQSHDDVICNTCKLSSHRRCDTTDINHQAQQMKRDGSFKDTRTRLEDLKSKYDKLKVTRHADKGIVKSKLDKCLQDMHQIRKNLNEALDRIENTLSTEIHQVNESATKDIENHIAILDDALTQISDHVKSLEDCENSQNDDVMYIGMKKASNITSRYEDIISKIEDELDRTEITFQINGDLYDMVKYIQSIDTVLIDSSRFSLQTNKGHTDGQGSKCGISYSRNTQKTLMNLFLSGKRDIDVGSRAEFGCTFMPDGHLVLGCGSEGLILLDKDFKVKSKLDVSAYRVAVSNHNEIIIANGGQKQIQRVKLLPKMKVTKTMRMDRNCYGVDVSGDEIYVTSHDLPGNGEVQVINMDGSLHRRLGVSNGEYMFKQPDYVTVNTDGSRVFISDWGTHIVTCLDKQGHVIYEYSDTYLNSPTGMYLDREGYLLVCGFDSHNVHVIGLNGRKEKILLSKTDGIEHPWCTAFRQSDRCLVVGVYTYTTKPLISFTLK